MKVLFLTNEYPPHIYGGAGVHVDYLSRALAQVMDVEVRCFGDQRAEGGRLRVAGHRIDERLFDGTDPRLRSPLQALSRCTSFTAEPIDADVVHCHTWYSHFGGIVAKLIYGLPLVVTTHSLEPQRAWKREQLGRGYELSSWLERTAIEMADHVIAVSRGMQRDIVNQFRVDADRVTVIYNGIDTDEYRPVDTTAALARYGIDPDVPYVLFLGRITRQKGILHLVNAVRYLDPGMQVVLCAGAPDTPEIGRAMAATVQQMQAQHPRLIWIQEMVEKRVAIELYSHAAVFCCPSVYEPFGIINLEALACQTPVVASAVGGIPEVVVDGETGMLVTLDQGPDAQPRDPDQFARDLAAAISHLMADGDLRRRMGMAGRARVVRLFGWPSIAREVFGVYEAVTQSNAPAARRTAARGA